MSSISSKIWLNSRLIKVNSVYAAQPHIYTDRGQAARRSGAILSNATWGKVAPRFAAEQQVTPTLGCKIVESDKMKSTERSAKLKEEADDLLREIELEELCRGIGKLTPTGSYYLDLMIYPDIDLYLPPAKPSQLFQIAAHLAERYPVVRVTFQNGGPGPLKNSLYIKPVIAIGNWERPWKIDIWATDPAFIDEKSAELRRYKEKITTDLRELILDYKYSLLTEEGRTPMFSGIYIYQAVLEHGIREFSEITAYLRENSIAI